MSKAFLIDVAKCSGCHGCQVSCKDEHCEQSWLPYAEAQPLTGSFWCKVEEKERGKTPVVTVSYKPVICNHCEDCALLAIGDDAVYQREDGLVIIDPTKAKGRRDLVDACPLGVVYWNEALELPQKCTGCAHLLDDGWSVPRCVDSCAHKAIKFGEVEDLNLDSAEFLPQVEALGPRVYYKNLQKRFAAGCVYDADVNDIIEGADVALVSKDGSVVASMKSDYLGDWKFDQIEAASYNVSIQAEGYESLDLAVDVTTEDKFIGDFAMKFIGTEDARTPEPLDPPRNLHNKERKPIVLDESELSGDRPMISAAMKIGDLAKIEEAAAVIEAIMPGFLGNKEVMEGVAGRSFKLLGALAPDKFPAALVDALDEKLRALN